MAQCVALLASPPREPAGAENVPLDTTARLVTECVEDLDLAERVERALRATGYPPLRRVAVTAHARTVTLGGRVPSYYLKQVAQTSALSVSGMHQVRNDLQVSRPT